MRILTLLLMLTSLGATQAGPPPDDPWQVLTLPEELIELIERDIAGPARNLEDRFERLVEFMHRSDGVDFRYQSTPTLDSTGTFAAGEGNCLSFTLLFISMARHLGLDARAREVRIRPNWESDNDLLKLITHVNVGVRVPGREAIVEFEPDLLRGQRLGSPFRGRTVSDERALAHFHNNRAVELLSEGKDSLARAWIDQALLLDGEFVPALNTLGVIQRRQGNRNQARASFQQALALNPGNKLAEINLAALDQPVNHREPLWLAGLPATGGKAATDPGASKFDKTGKPGQGRFATPD